MSKKLSDGVCPSTQSVLASLDPDSYDRLVYVADYFEWTIRSVAANILRRALANVKFGEDLNRADWSDPRRLKNKNGGNTNGKD